MTTQITITSVGSGYGKDGVLYDAYAYTLLLRRARKVGDQEKVGNYQLGLLRRAKEYGALNFTETRI